MVGSTVRGLMILLFWLVSSKVGGIAQLGEHLLCKQGVIGSIPIVSTTTVCKANGARSPPVPSRRQSFAQQMTKAAPQTTGTRIPIGY